jgi:hypothetical protein
VRSATFGLAGFVNGPMKFLEALLRMLNKRTPGLRDGGSFMAAVEKLYLDLVFNGSQPLAECRLTDSDSPCGDRNIALLVECHNKFEIANFELG